MKEQATLEDMKGSNLLQALRAEDIERLRQDMDVISVEAGQVIYEPGDTVYHAYLPLGMTVVSYIVLMNDSRRVETAMIGREGALGGIVSQGLLPAYCQALVQYPGKMLRIESVKLDAAKTASPALRNFFARYADCLLTQIFQTVACNATHTIEQRTAKWLLAAMDRTGDHAIPLTQEQLAGMLGVGRSYVARIMGVMKRNGMIHTMRGQLRVEDLDKLKSLSCNCNELTREHFENVLAGVYPNEADSAVKS